MLAPTHHPRLLTGACLVLTALLMAGCGTKQSAQRDAGSMAGIGGQYPVGSGNYRKDGPHANPPANLDRVPDAVPRIEPLASGANRPYVINGTRYVPDTSGNAYRIRGRASWYGREFHGRPTSNGERYDMYAMTAAHPTLPIPSYARVSRADGTRSIIVRINDRGPFHSSRVIDLSYVAAYRLGYVGHGTTDVMVEAILPAEIRAMQGGGGSWASAAPAAVATPVGGSQPQAIRVVNGTAAAPATQGWTPPAATPVASLPGPIGTPLPAAIPQPAGAVATGAVFLQLGAFGDANNARSLAARVQPQLTHLGTVAVMQKNDLMYRVQLGPFSDSQTALNNVGTVYTQTGIMPQVVAR